MITKVVENLLICFLIGVSLFFVIVFLIERNRLKNLDGKWHELEWKRREK